MTRALTAEDWVKIEALAAQGDEACVRALAFRAEVRAENERKRIRDAAAEAIPRLEAEVRRLDEAIVHEDERRRLLESSVAKLQGERDRTRAALDAERARYEAHR